MDNGQLRNPFGMILKRQNMSENNWNSFKIVAERHHNCQLSIVNCQFAEAVKFPFIRFLRNTRELNIHFFRRGRYCSCIFLPVWYNSFWSGREKVRILGMGKSQRYQAAVDGHDTPPGSLEFFSEKTLAFWRPEPEYGKLSQTLGDGLGKVSCYPPPLGAFFIVRFPRRKGDGYDP